MQEPIIYRCTFECPIRKHCFIIKTDKPLSAPLLIYQKCIAAHGQDIQIIIGDDKPP